MTLTWVSISLSFSLCMCVCVCVCVCVFVCFVCHGSFVRSLSPLSLSITHLILCVLRGGIWFCVWVRGFCHALWIRSIFLPFQFCTYLISASQDGPFVYFTDSSDRYGRNKIILEFLSGRPSGKVMLHNRETGVTSVLLDGLPLTNGLTLSHDKQLVFHP